MPQRKLQDALAELQHQLEHAPDFSEEERLELERMRDELDLVLEPDQADPPDVVEKVDEAITRFEIRHPKLTEIMNRIAHALSAMGV